MKYSFNLQPQFFDSIKNGQKKIEVRLYDEKRRQIKIGDLIEFSKEPEREEKVLVRVTGILNYETFTLLANDFPSTMFGHPDTEDLLKSIYTFYKPEDEQKYTVVGIRIELVK
jgi:ASC-1-like (ASCH) protein